MDPLQHIEALFALHGHRPYEGARREPVTMLEHALQCAQLAEWADARTTLVIAALLHDIGHFIGTDGIGDDEDDTHETRAVPLLVHAFGAAVAEPVRLHVAAKRYLVATDAAYAGTLSSASVHSLGLQGGPMTLDERTAFDALPHAGEALMLRRWDDMAKTPGKPTPPLAWYLTLMEELREDYLAGTRSRIGVA